MLANLSGLGIDHLIAIGGDDTLGYAARLNELGVKVIAIPKTMDNDVRNTEYCIGFSTAITRASDAIQRQRTTVASHERIGIFRVFGRDAGFTALYTAYVTSIRCVIPEYKVDLDKLIALLMEEKRANPSNYALVVLSEGAEWEGYEVREYGEPDAYGHRKKASVAEALADEIKRRTGEETIVSDLTYDLRSGDPDFVDKLVALTFGNMAYDAILDGKTGLMSALVEGCYELVPIPDPKLGPRKVDVAATYNTERPPPGADGAGQRAGRADQLAERKGLYFLDTRVVSNWAIYANGEPWELLNGGPVTYHAARIFLTNRAILTEDGAIPPRTVGLTISRWISGGLHEDLDITNNSMKPIRFQLEIAFRCDFADIFEVKSGKIVRRGQITTEWSERRQRVRTAYSNKDFQRAVTIAVVHASSKAVSANGRLSFEVALQPGEAWHACLLYTLEDGEQALRAPPDCFGQIHKSRHSESMAEWLETVVKIRTSNEEFYRLFHQALEDMAALRLPIKGTDHVVFLPAAGLPWFVAPFGRDSLIVSLQNALIYPEFARGALEILGSLQAKEDDPYRDAEPGKILHELRYGELAHFKLIPHTPYYGTADATPLYLITLHSAWRATGDKALLEQHLPTAEGCLAWIDKYGDRDGDGFQEYQTRSPVGYENMAWKDSGDSVMYPDGSLVKGPKALCELQGYVYNALGPHGGGFRCARQA